MSSKPAHHHPVRGFRNPEGSPRHEATRADFYRFLWHGLSGRLNRAPTIPAGHVLTPTEAAAGFAAVEGSALQWLGHSAFRWKIHNTVILSDPLLTDRASPFSWIGPKRFIPSPLAPEEAKADIILITHNHYDHLDLETLKRLPNKETVHVIAPLHLSPLIKKANIATITELDWHQPHQTHLIPPLFE